MVSYSWAQQPGKFFASSQERSRLMFLQLGKITEKFKMGETGNALQHLIIVVSLTWRYQDCVVWGQNREEEKRWLYNKRFYTTFIFLPFIPKVRSWILLPSDHESQSPHHTCSPFKNKQGNKHREKYSEHWRWEKERDTLLYEGSWICIGPFNQSSNDWSTSDCCH